MPIRRCHRIAWRCEYKIAAVRTKIDGDAMNGILASTAGAVQQHDRDVVRHPRSLAHAIRQDDDVPFRRIATANGTDAVLRRFSQRVGPGRHLVE